MQYMSVSHEHSTIGGIEYDGGGYVCWKYALEAIIKWLLLYFLVHDNCIVHAIIVLSGNRNTCVNT